MKKGVQEVFVGGWYARTTLHLSEVYEFFLNGNSKLKLSKTKLKLYWRKLGLQNVTRELEGFEYVRAETKSGIEINYYEDGLYLLRIKNPKNDKDVKKLRKYLEDDFLPAISFIFSLGAPTPKILANIGETHPTVITILDSRHDNHKINEMKYGTVYSKIVSKSMTVYKTIGYIFVVVSPTQKDIVKELVGMQVFFREFKDQLERYLDIHRKIWEDISKIKEREYLIGKNIPDYRRRLEGYQASIRLIRNRINQMDTYARTRGSLAGKLGLEGQLLTLFRYRFEDLFGTLTYIKELWSMTADYVNSGINMVNEVENKATRGSVRSIQILASVGVIAGILGYLTRDQLPSLTRLGWVYLVALAIIATIVNYIIKGIYKRKKYKLKFTETSKVL